MQQVTPLALQEVIQSDRQVLLLDVREPWEYEICSIAGSRNIAMNDIPGSLGQLDPAAPVAVICHHGMRSRQVAEFLEANGFNEVLNLAGGIHAWAEEVEPDMKKY